MVKKSTTWTVHERSFVDGHGRAGGRERERERERNGTERNGTRERSTERDGARRARGVTMKPVVGRVVLRVEAKVRRDADATLVIFWFAPGKGPGSFNSPLPGWFVRKKRDERNGTEWNGMEWNGMEDGVRGDDERVDGIDGIDEERM